MSLDCQVELLLRKRFINLKIFERELCSPLLVFLKNLFKEFFKESNLVLQIFLFDKKQKAIIGYFLIIAIVIFSNLVITTNLACRAEILAGNI